MDMSASSCHFYPHRTIWVKAWSLLGLLSISEWIHKAPILTPNQELVWGNIAGTLLVNLGHRGDNNVRYSRIKGDYILRGFFLMVHI